MSSSGVNPCPCPCGSGPCPCPYDIVLVKSLFSIDILPRTRGTVYTVLIVVTDCIILYFNVF